MSLAGYISITQDACDTYRETITSKVLAGFFGTQNADVGQKLQ